MLIGPKKIQAILDLVEQIIPGWTGFTDPKFEEEEVTYKRIASKKAQELLSKAELDRLLYEQDFDEIIKRIRQVASSTNLLFLGIPSSGDLGIINHPNLDKDTFCHAVSALLNSPTPSHVRLEKFTAYVNAFKLPNRWTFPTYLLFLCHPETDLFIKPAATEFFLQQIGLAHLWNPTPNGKTYEDLLAIAQELKAEMQEFGPRDMIDIQGVIWLVRRTIDESPN